MRGCGTGDDNIRFRKAGVKLVKPHGASADFFGEGDRVFEASVCHIDCPDVLFGKRFGNEPSRLAAADN